MCQQVPSSPLGTALALVVVLGIVVERPEDGENLFLFAPLDVLLEGGSHGLSFRFVLAHLLRFRKKRIVNGKIAWHSSSACVVYHTFLCVEKCVWQPRMFWPALGFPLPVGELLAEGGFLEFADGRARNSLQEDEGVGELPLGEGFAKEFA